MGRYEELHRNQTKVLNETRKLVRGTKSLVSEKKTVVKDAGDLITQQWSELVKNPVRKTGVFETIPLVYAMSTSSPDDMTISEMKGILSQNKDWDSNAKSWLMTLIELIGNDKKLYRSFVDNIVYGKILSKSGDDLKDLNGGEPISDFIHGSISGKNGFYNLLPKDSKSKEFTADVILFWNNSNVAKDVLRAGPDSPLNNMAPNDEDPNLVDLDDGTLMACVSLKALEGKIGKLTKFVVNKYADGSMEMVSQDETNENLQINEGLFSSMANMFSSALGWVKNTKIAKKLKEWYDSFKNWSKNLFDMITKIVSPTSPSVTKAKTQFDRIKKDADELLSEFDKELSEHLKRNGITEASDTEEIQISNCFAKKLESWYQKFNSDVSQYNKTFQDFGTKISRYEKSKFLKIQFESLDTENKSFQDWIASVKTFMEDELGKTKEGTIISSKSDCRFLMKGNKPFKISRAKLKPILMSNANFTSISIINDIIDQFIGSFSETDTDKALNDLIKFSTELNSEAIFGGVYEIPLIKYDGTKILKLGTRKKYEEETVKNMSKQLKGIDTLPIVGIKVYPSGKEKGSVIPTYYSIIMYGVAEMIENIEKGKTDTRSIEEKLLYNEIMFSCNSGSQFRFAIESPTRITGKQLLAKLNKNLPV
jgi:hypothetical protein